MSSAESSNHVSLVLCCSKKQTCLIVVVSVIYVDFTGLKKLEASRAASLRNVKEEPMVRRRAYRLAQRDWKQREQ